MHEALLWIKLNLHDDCHHSQQTSKERWSKEDHSITQYSNWHAYMVCILRSGLNSVNYLVKLRLNLNGLNYDWKNLIAPLSKCKWLTLAFDMSSQVWWVLI